MRDLIIDTSRYASEKKFILSETSISTPHSSASTMSASLPPDASSEVGSDSVSPVPDVTVKTENAPSPLLESLQESVSPTSSTPSRKHLAPAERSSTEDHKKVRVSERSKTGCFTCRRRKKKCDETKPSCNNCTKTNYACEGYPSRKQYNVNSRRGSRAKGEDGSGVPSELDEGHLLNRPIDSDRKLVLPPQPSLPTFPAVENEDDHRFLDHYINKTSQILFMNDSEEGNPWTELLLPMAKDDQALMHSVLALAGSHLVRTSRYQRLRDRQMFHVGAALAALRRRLSETTPGDSNSELIMASMILQFLMSKNDASPSHSPQAHLKAAQTFLKAPDTPFWRFAWSFCTYHEFSTTFSSLPGPDPRPNFELVDAEATGADAGTAANGAMRQHFSILVGVVNVSFMTLISKITMLRDRVRQRQVQGIVPSVHFSMLTTADELGRDIAQWQSGQPPGTARHVAAELHRRASLLYLLRTVRAAASPESRGAFATCVQQGLECLQLLPTHDPVQSGLLLPTFILGCGAFEAKHRTALGLALDTIEAYSGFGNVRPVRDILHHVWATMDAGDVDRSWDWETLTQEMGYAALIT